MDTPLRDNLATTIAGAARAARVRLGLTQAEVAGLMDLSAIVYNRLERAKMLPSVPTLIRLCETLQASPGEILGFSRPTVRGKLKPSAEDAPSLHQLLNLARKLDEAGRQTLVTVAKSLLRK
jgi:transcriptional regulator with XRE-family HTH domain